MTRTSYRAFSDPLLLLTTAGYDWQILTVWTANARIAASLLLRSGDALAAFVLATAAANASKWIGRSTRWTAKWAAIITSEAANFLRHVVKSEGADAPTASSVLFFAPYATPLELPSYILNPTRNTRASFLIQSM